jgi:hypothetical protein
LRRHPIAVGVGAMQLAKRGKLAEHDNVVDFDRRGIELNSAVLIDGEVAEQARDRICMRH